MTCAGSAIGGLGCGSGGGADVGATLCKGDGRCGSEVPKEPADVLEVAREREWVCDSAPPEDEDAASRRVDPWELKELKRGLKLPPVPGLSAPVVALEKPLVREPLESGGRGVALMLSRLRREKIVMRASFLGRMTTSRNVIRVMRRTSSSSPKEGRRSVPPELEGRSSDLEKSGIAPQNSEASLALIMAPRPLNSRSRGRNTAWMKGRMCPKTMTHTSTSFGTRRSSGTRRRVWAIEEKPVCSNSRRSSIRTTGALFCTHLRM